MIQRPATAKKHSISLTQEMEDAIQRRLATGRYASDGDVIRAALRVLECYDEERRGNWPCWTMRFRAGSPMRKRTG